MKAKNLASLLVLFLLVFSGCKNEKANDPASAKASQEQKMKYAKGFNILDYEAYTLLTVTQAWPGSDKTFRYALLKQGQKLPDSVKTDAVINIPVQSIVVTSTTHIPALELLRVEASLKGFPNLDYISSPKTRARIKNGEVQELGQNESINTESAINLNPDAVITFGVEGENKTINSLQRAGIPVLYNGDWTETTPLGQAEWIKFFAALYDKQDMADSIFNGIEKRYLDLKQKAATAPQEPTVISGAMFKDVWYLPKGDSWAATLVADAHGDYLYKDTEGTGSAALSIEEVLNTAQNADFWIAPNAFERFSDLAEANEAYTRFKAFNEQNIYSFAAAKGETGGMLYYELASSRPDWVLEDLVAILHPQLLTDHQFHFYSRLED
ncbi:ABC transporter substrate-binding protein [Leeuwenhoekiella parthenopeia]|uniref:ABC transporter substrate-binding protein n=1 Tax=Leeuwenhoekiella parthenopeia TaxID=2890320 RepID=A0ABS8GSY5_9FLAO|nr:ABC transporter substrate-binding protein [Leeuwenhoekiella parthenopeia]MCC4213111.1 ABC transporter substrate-binding protein [Leeuwenhoekiella parthenopeia]